MKLKAMNLEAADADLPKPDQALKNKMYVLMSMLVFAWGMEYIFAKQALEVIKPMTLLFLKFITGFALILAIKLKIDGKSLMRKKDIPIFIACALFGDLGYFYSEYTAMSYLPVSLITIVLAFVPVLSVIIERVVYKNKTTKKMMAGIFLSILGIALIIGVDSGTTGNNQWIGYLLAFSAVVLWNLYNFITASLHSRYTSLTLTLNQLICAILLVFPYAMTHLPDWKDVSGEVFLGVLYLGVVSTGICFIILVKSLKVLGPTITSMFSNFLPVTTALFGWIFLKEVISPVQILGGAVVITAGYVVIKEKSRLEQPRQDMDESTVSNNMDRN